MRGAAHAPRRRDARGVDGSWHMAVLFRCIESYGVVAPLEDDCHPCVQVIINLYICTATRVAPTDCRVHDRPLRHKRQYSNASCDDGRWLGRGRSCASSTPSEKPTFTRKQPVREPRPLVSTYASLPVVALAPTTRVRSISHLASPAGACLQVLTTCRSAASRRAFAAVRALREPTCLSIV